MPDKNTQSKPTDNKASGKTITQVVDRIKKSENVLVALSKNPSVDELSAALGLTFVLDKMGKHATAIFSGEVPNAIEFLEPEKTFESNTNSLQDFIIALDKDKADHLRYKVEGDFVRVYITPYRTTLDENDLEFSHGDFNVDLIVAINVNAEADLDSALSEYGKIKHDATSVNLHAANPGNFADIEWGEPSASSVSEMVVNLTELLDDNAGGQSLIDQSTATALLAGIVSATNRFSNEHTSPDTMQIAATLMSKGADQQLISSSISSSMVDGGVVDMSGEVEKINETPAPGTPVPTIQEVLAHHGEEKPASEAPSEATPTETAPAEPAPAPVEKPAEAPTLEAPTPTAPAASTTSAAPEIPTAPETPAAPEEAPVEEELSAKKPDIVPDLPTPEPSPIEPSDQMPTTQAEASAIETTAVPAPAEAEPVPIPTPELEPLAEPISDTPNNAIPVMPNTNIEQPVAPPTSEFQPAVDPTVPPTQPTDSNEPEFVAPPLPMPSDDALLPPPPAPFDLGDNPEAPAPVTEEITPVSFGDTPAPETASAQEFVSNIQGGVNSNEPIMPEPQLPSPDAAPAAEPAPNPNVDPNAPIQPAYLQEMQAVDPSASPSVNGVNPVMQDQVYNDPSSFQIPGM